MFLDAFLKRFWIRCPLIFFGLGAVSRLQALEVEGVSYSLRRALARQYRDAFSPGGLVTIEDLTKFINGFLKSEGYYAPQLTYLPRENEEGVVEELPLVYFQTEFPPKCRIDLGDPIYVSKVTLTGPEGTDAEVRELLSALEGKLQQFVGRRLRHIEYTNQKAEALSLLQASGYRRARWKSTVLKLNLVQGTAQWNLEVDPGPLHMIRSLYYQQDKIPTERLQQLVELEVGEACDWKRVSLASQKLLKTGWFEQVIPSVLPEGDSEEEVALTFYCVPKKRFYLGFGLSVGSGWDSKLEVKGYAPFFTRHGGQLTLDLLFDPVDLLKKYIDLSFISNSPVQTFVEHRVKVAYEVPYFFKLSPKLGYSFQFYKFSKAEEFLKIPSQKGQSLVSEKLQMRNLGVYFRGLYRPHDRINGWLACGPARLSACNQSSYYYGVGKLGWAWVGAHAPPRWYPNLKKFSLELETGIHASAFPFLSKAVQGEGAPSLLCGHLEGSGRVGSIKRVSLNWQVSLRKNFVYRAQGNGDVLKVPIDFLGILRSSSFFRGPTGYGAMLQDMAQLAAPPSLALGGLTLNISANKWWSFSPYIDLALLEPHHFVAHPTSMEDWGARAWTGGVCFQFNFVVVQISCYFFWFKPEKPHTTPPAAWRQYAPSFELSLGESRF